MKASIVIPNLNGAGWLRDSIESIWAQMEQDFELIIIDNGSTDESLAIARSYVGRPGYTLVENQTNTGFSAAVNTGIGLAKGEYVVLFNNDAFAQPDWLAQLIAMADAEPRAITVSDIRVVNAPSGVDVKVITESINNVTLVGEAEELAAISPSDVIAQVDASAQNITVKGSGQQQFSAQIIVTGTKTVFATGAYSVLCDITVK